MRSILITGAWGLLGRALQQQCDPGKSPPTPFGRPRIFPLGRSDWDICDEPRGEKVLDELRPDVLLNCASTTDVDGCESHKEEAFRVNGLGPAVLTKLCVERGIRLVHVSTDYVFDGTKGAPYREEDPPGPLSVYGASKLEGEKAVLGILPGARVEETSVDERDVLVVRTARLYGPGAKRSFVKTMLEAATVRKEIRVVNDQTGAPTYSVDLARILFELAGGEVRGIVHATNDGSCTWFDWAKEILRLARREVPVTAVTTAEFPRPAKRPAYSVLDLGRLRSFGVQPRPWQEALAEFLSGASV